MVKAMNEEIERQYNEFLQRGNIEGKSWVELKKMFLRMNLTEKRELSKNNPTLYKELTSKNRWREGETI